MDDIIAEIDREIPPSQAKDAKAMLLKVFSNIVNNPGEAKYRMLKKDNKAVAEKLCVSPSVISLLMTAGFEDQGAAYSCPMEAGLEDMAACVELLECIVLSQADDGAVEAKAPPPAAAAPAAAPPAPAVAATNGGYPKAPPRPTDFARRTDVEKQRSELADQLQAVRATQASQFTTPAEAPAATAAAQPTGTFAEAKTTKAKSAFEFSNRSKEEKKLEKAAESLQDIRKAQKEKFKDFKADPNAKQAPIYQQPPSTANGAKVEQGWGDWLGGMFGGGSSSSGGGNGKPKPDRDDRKPNIKGIGDLPKPVQRG